MGEEQNRSGTDQDRMIGLGGLGFIPAQVEFGAEEDEGHLEESQRHTN